MSESKGKRVDTVNVIEFADDDLQGITSYEESEEGNTEASAHFRQCATEHGCLEIDVDSFIEDGYFEQGTYQLFLTHS